MEGACGYSTGTERAVRCGSSGGSGVPAPCCASQAWRPRLLARGASSRTAPSVPDVRIGLVAADLLRGDVIVVWFLDLRGFLLVSQSVIGEVAALFMSLYRRGESP